MNTTTTTKATYLHLSGPSPVASGAEPSCRLLRKLNVAYWDKPTRRNLQEMWATAGGVRRSNWDYMWLKLPESKNWFHADDIFLEQLKPHLPVGANCLQLGPGRSKVADGIISTGSVASLLNIDVSEQLIAELLQKHNGKTSQPTTRVGFEVMDSFNLRFSDFEKRGWGNRFDVVIEKAGVFDIHRKSTDALQRVLACLVTEVFQPSVGGLLIVAVSEEPDPAEFARCRNCPEGDTRCVPCRVPQSGLEKALEVRPDFNCSLLEAIQVYPQTLRLVHRAVKVLIIRCAGVNKEYARAGCGAVWKRACD